MLLKKLPLSKFGTLIQLIYNVELCLKIEWMWDGGFDWQFGDTYNGFYEASEATKELSRSADNTDLEAVGGLIIHEYLQRWDGLDSLGNQNNMFEFLKESGFLDHYNFIGRQYTTSII